MSELNTISAAAIAPVKRRRNVPGELYVVISDEGVSILKAEAIKTANVAGCDIYELGRKVKTLIYKPGTTNLLTGEKDDDDVRVEYEVKA